MGIRKIDQFKSRVNLYLDNELENGEEKALLNEMKTNSEFRKVFDEECSFKEMIKNNIERKQVSVDLINSIKNKIHDGPSMR